MLVLIQILDILLNVVWWIIFAQFILSLLLLFNVISLSNDGVRAVYAALDRMTEPMYRPIRRVLPTFGTLDLSPMVVLIVVRILQAVVLPALAAQFAVPAVYG